MSHLLAVSVGPVQEFIAAARRTRDLWFGSYLLSEISRAVAKVVEQHGKLIFPASSDADNVANKILAEVNDPQAVAEDAKLEARECWEAHGKRVRQELDKYPIKVIVPDIWEEQLPDAIEFFAAWIIRTSDYQADRKRVERLLTGRKNCKDFLTAKGRAGVPKSSLDGQLESVLLQPPPGVDRKTFRDNWPTVLRLSSGEQLDVIGVTKRLGKKKREPNAHYPSVARVAAETWLQGVLKQGKLQPLFDACKRLVDKKLHEVLEERYQYFPFEGTVIYKDRHTDLRQELGLGDHDLDEVATALKQIGGEPNPYLAILVADGDSMGAKLSELSRVKDHQSLSEKLAKFANHAKEIVQKDHDGVLIYSGGDDAVAMVPVHKCLHCARALRNQFRSETGMTLSVGIAIGHFMENLEDLLDYGRTAEKAAKKVKGKDALAVHLHKRGGATIKIAAQWESSLDARLLDFARLMNNGTIPANLPYELRSMAKLYEPWAEAAIAIKADLFRLIAKKQSRSVETMRDSIEKYLEGMTAEKLLAFAEQLLVARQIAAALKQCGEGVK